MRRVRSTALLVHGSDPPPTPALNLRAGLLSLLFEPDTVWARRLSLGGVEVVRAIYAAVRDRSWGTVTPRIESLETEAAPDSFRLRFGVSCRDGEIDFYWRGDISGTASSEIVFDFDGEARSTFLRNRLGLCVLHPLATCAGHPCEVEHVDGSVKAGAFPAMIAPHQPLRDIRAIRYAVAKGAEVEVRLEGDTFEMEDQRNWTDASFKTYCTPLELPLPVRVEAGTRIRQRATVRLRVSAASAFESTKALKAPERSATEIVMPETASRPLPPIGLGMATHQRPLSQRESALLRSLGLSHLRVEVSPSAAGWEQSLRRSIEEARKLGTPLEMAVHLPVAPETALDAFGEVWRGLDATASRWIVSAIGDTRCHGAVPRNGPGAAWEPRPGRAGGCRVGQVLRRPQSQPPRAAVCGVVPDQPAGACLRQPFARGESRGPGPRGSERARVLWSAGRCLTGDAPAPTGAPGLRRPRVRRVLMCLRLRSTGGRWRCLALRGRSAAWQS